ncbi:Cof subfamily protein (haloacid dehalogenase superfamily) [Streptomyces griseochromogenes]|uniref:Cof subfamily protein (Haloacid dehalogenase superfamily) n=1 Tax=Streptomyces griseochromogenes TaxID=68214 RepID=A0A1B1AW59_9ACTN|nr:Cof-type HAD-IIB family hydrolase [Streptomyces griseochromogenes]ANP50816.1 HAD family hydrolase [Streptomyces griseochromogenes]MBP2051629.1 Cof subfamily protein (haloacid dehalogenase superfamily) [Streptomyces griseochromogenes]
MPATPASLLETPGSPAGSADIRLVVTDMDGTLLDDAKRIPDGLWPMLAELRRRGVLFSPASGRQYATLARQFAEVAEGMVFIAENGTYVVRDGVELSSDPLDRSVAADLARTVRRLVADGVDVGAVVCGKRSAYVERTDEAFLAEVRKYYVEHRIVEDVTAVEDEVIKVALFDFGSAEHATAPALRSFAATHQVVVSGEHWVDVMNRAANKGAALRGLQRELGITPAQTMVFGDYLNDLEMLDAAEWSFAMANAHPEVVRRARHLAPSNNDNGVLRTVAEVVGIPLPPS